jgi:hypothetical protein
MRLRPIALLLPFSVLATTAAAQDLSAERMLDHVQYLAKDELAGRESGEPGADSAAAYIETRLKEYGLTPLFDDGASFRQAFGLTTTVRVDPASRLLLENPVSSVELSLGNEWYPASYSSAGEVQGRSAYVGYGMEASDYDTLKLARAAIAIVDGGTPEDWNPHTGGDPSLRRRATLARDAGAKAVMLLVSELDKPEVGDLPRPLGIPVVQVVPDPRTEPLLTGGYVGVALTADVRPVEATVFNIGGVVKGSADDGRTIVIGAHYDHLGMGGPGSLAPDQTAPHNGADDNASGTAVLLELAHHFATAGTTPPVDLAFVAFTAEEMGLLGSSHFVSNSPVHLDDVIAMLNFDMVGRLREGKLQVFGTETAAEFSDILDAAGTGGTLTVSRVGDGYGPSDQTSFYARGVPVLHFFSGTHSEYHRPEDDWDLINAEGMVAIGEFAADVTTRIADRPDRLTYVEQKRPESPSPRRGYGPYLGTIPDFSPVEGGGLGITGVRPGSPAEIAGLTGGDVIIMFDGKDVTSINDYAIALREHAPGDTVAIRIRRAGEEIDMEAVLGKR